MNRPARLLRLIRPVRGRLLLALTASAAGAAALAAVAPLTGVLVDRGLSGATATIPAWSALMLLAVAVHVAGVGAAERFFGDVAAEVARRQRNTLTDRLADAPLAAVERHPPGDLQARAGVEIDEIADFVAARLPALAVAAGYLVFSTVVLFGHSVALTAVLLAVYLPAAALLLARYRARSRDAFTAEAERAAELTGLIAEGAAAAGLLREPAAASWWAARVADRNTALLAAIRHTIGALNLFPFLAAIEAAALAAVIGLGGRLVAAGTVEVATVAVFVVASGALFASFGQLGDALAALAPTRAYARRHFDLVDALSPAAVAPAVAADGAVHATNVHFGYPGRGPALAGASVTLPAGSRTVVVGPSGAGKSTLAKLLAGLYEPDAGEVGPGAAVVLVPQETFLIPATLRVNLLLPDDVPANRVEHTVTALGLDAWVDALGGLDGRLDPAALSAADRQRIGVLRAAVREPAVLILDEATASMDEDAARDLHRRLDRQAGDRTVIVVTHRPATVPADHVVTVAAGGTVTVSRAASRSPRR